MKIVRVITRLNVGGPAIHAVLLAHELRRMGHQHVLAVGSVPASEGAMEYYADRWNVALARIPELSRAISLSRDLVAWWKLYRLMRRERPEIVHTHTAKAGALGRTAALMAGVPLVFHTFHGHVFEGYFSTFATRVVLAIERFLARFTDGIIAISESQRRELVETYEIAGPEKVHVIRLGFDLKPFLGPPLRPLPAREDPSSPPAMVLWAGRFTEIKAPLLLLETALAARRLGLRARFVMVGDGHLRPQVERRIREAGLGEYVILRGWQEQMPPFYSEADCLLLTSRNEGTPVAVIEAMAAGCVCIAPSVGGVTDLMAGEAHRQEGFRTFSNGILVDQREPAAFVRALQWLLRNQEAQAQMRMAARDFVQRGFAKERLAEELIELYVLHWQQRNFRAATPAPSPAAEKNDGGLRPPPG